MSHIKINYTGLNGKRTSTTINRNIAFHFYLTNNPMGFKGLPDNYEEDMKQMVQKFANELTNQIDKNNIESAILHEIVNRTRDNCIEAFTK